LRVLNVLKHWVDKHFYDFREEDQALLVQLIRFIRDSPHNPAMKTARNYLTKAITKQRQQAGGPIQVMWNEHETPPEVEWLIPDPDMYHILSLSPYEVARQLTLIESEMYVLLLMRTVTWARRACSSCVICAVDTTPSSAPTAAGLGKQMG